MKARGEYSAFMLYYWTRAVGSPFARVVWLRRWGQAQTTTSMHGAS